MEVEHSVYFFVGLTGVSTRGGRHSPFGLGKVSQASKYKDDIYKDDSSGLQISAEGTYCSDFTKCKS